MMHGQQNILSILLRQNTTDNQEYFINMLLTDTANQRTRRSKIYLRNCNKI
jgi:hypothetical protein